MMNLDELEKLAKAAHNDGWEHAYALADRWQEILALIAEVRALRETIKRQASAARMGMDAAKASGAIMLELAQQARAASSPDVLASERAMNAMMTEEVERLTADRDHWQANHDNQVSRARFLIERSDIPVERVRAYEEMGALLELEEAIRHDREMFADMSDEFNPTGTLVTKALAAIDAARKERA
jgi:hypothetical protein